MYHIRDCESLTTPKLAQVGISATAVVTKVEKIDAECDLALYCPHYIFRTMALAGAVLLRMAKALRSISAFDMAAAYGPYLFQAISLLKRMSVEENDGPSRMARIFSRLWTTDEAFQPDHIEPDGAQTPILGLRVHSRLSMSILHDTTRWYHHLFENGAADSVAASKNGKR